MSIILEGVDITGLVLEEVSFNLIESISEKSISNSIVFFEMERKFKKFNLVGGENFGWLSKSVFETLNDMANTLGSFYTLDFEGDIKLVRFRTDEELPVFGDQIIKRTNENPEDFYNNVVLKLIQYF